MHSGFGAPSVNDHDGLIGPVDLLFIDIHHVCEHVGGMGGIFHVDIYVVGGYFFRMVFYFCLPESSSKGMSF